MNVTLCSIFRDSARYVRRYFDQIDALREHVNVRVVGTWGDCEDHTHDLLKGRDIELYEYHHGGPHFGSVDHGPRWDNIAKVVRHTLDMVGDPGDALIWVESDLIWRPETMLTLLGDLDNVGAVAPMAMATSAQFDCGPERFYDIWGYRQDGQWFNAYPPYYRGEPDPNTGLVKIDSCGSCWVAADDSFWRDWTGHWPFPAEGQLWLDPKVRTRHP